MTTAATHKTDQIPADPVHRMLVLYPDEYKRAHSRLSREQVALIRRVFLKSYNTQRDVEVIAAELPSSERLEWAVLSNAFSRALGYLREKDGGD